MKLIRYKSTKTTVLGILKDDVGGTYCTLENATTLIPKGNYNVVVCHSPKFNKPLPLLSNSVVGTNRGIRIHEGNDWHSSSGCVIVGNGVNLSKNTLVDSVTALNQLIKNCGSKLEICDF